LGTNLIGVTPLTQAGCSVHFEGNRGTITCPNNQTITCHTTPQGLWALHIDALHGTPSGLEPAVALTTMGSSCTPADIVAFHHTAFFSPAIATLMTALQKNYIPPLPGLTAGLLRKYTPNLEATAMGHLDNRRKNIQSTKHKQVRFGDTAADTPFPAQPKDGHRTNACFLAGSEPRSIVYTDQTGRLPHPSSTGNNYILIAYDYDRNIILLRPYRSKTAEILRQPLRISIEPSPEGDADRSTTA
jgi:hypothetical protein